MNLGNQEPTETFWHHCLLVVILGVAACLRFYSIDTTSLSPDEVISVNACQAEGWFSMLSAYQTYSGMPPLYPSLLCAFTHLVGHADFFTRGLSALTGLASIYAIYLLGRDTHSVSHGLLAAAVMASSFQQAIVFDRSATLYSLLALGQIIHCLCFFHLLIRPSPTHRHFTQNFYGIRSTIEWKWHPDFPSDSRYLIGFWLSGALVFYTSPIAIIQFFCELAVSALLVNRLQSSRTRIELMRSLWMPLFIVCLPWVPVLYGVTSWVLQGNLFLFNSQTVSLWQKLQPLFPSSPLMLNVLVALLTMSFAQLAFNSIRAHQEKSKQDIFLFFATFQVLVAGLSLQFIASDAHSYLYYWWILALLLVKPVSSAIELLPTVLGRKLVIGIVALTVITFQTRLAVQERFYQPIWIRDFRQAVQIIHDDTSFMKSSKPVFSTSDLFNHYLEIDGINNNPQPLLDDNAPPETITALTKMDKFYFLEYLPYDMNLEHESPSFKLLSSLYQTACMTKLPWIRIAKFTTGTIPSPAPDCHDHLSGNLTLK
jgi:4-amino-4-deoxy-L-arabinose transferase-like glycosyltransferase